jgi:pimeloyl-ACP methyl ester carboxylesterase
MTFMPPLRHRWLRLPSGLQLEYVEQGRPADDTVLLLHGITDSWRSYEPVLPWMRSGRHVIALTLRGHGGSDKPATSYRIADFAADVADFATRLALPPLVVVGHSMGSAVAFRLAIDRPDLVAGVVGAGAFARYSDKPSIVDFADGASIPADGIVPRAVADAFQRGTVAGTVTSGLIETMVNESLRTPAAVWRAAFAGLLEDDFSAEVERIAAPVLLAWGDGDAFVPEEDQRELARRIPRAVRSVYRRAGHALHWEQPERFAEEVDAFVDRLGVVGAGGERLAA